MGAGARDGEDTGGDADRSPTLRAGAGDIHTTDSATGGIRPATATDGAGEARHGLRLDGAAMITHMIRRLVPLREGQGVRSRVAFTTGEAVGYTVHHEGVRYVTRMRGCSSHNARGPPAGTDEPLACLDCFQYDRRWCTAYQAITRATKTEAAAPRSN